MNVPIDFSVPIPIGRLIGLDVHRDQIYVTVLCLAEGSVEQYEVATREKDFEAFLASLRPDDGVALESTRGTRYYVKRLASRVKSVTVANTTKLQTLSGKTAKNDRNDSMSLVLLLGLGTLPKAWLADDETQQDRELLHYRHSIVKDMTRIKNRIRAQLAEHGLVWSGSDVASKDARLFLVKVRTRLHPVASKVIASQLEQLEHLEVQLARTEDMVKLRAARRPELALLMTIRGINVVTALTILSTVGSIERFPTSDSLVNYAGLVPRQRASAGHSHQGGITKAGSKALRAALTEAAQCLARAGAPYHNLYRRLEGRKKKKGVAMVAVARKLLEAIWHMLTHGEAFREAEPDLVERKTRRLEQRLTVARQRMAREKDREKEVITRQLALLQTLSRRRGTFPLPEPLRKMFSGSSSSVAASGP